MNESNYNPTEVEPGQTVLFRSDKATYCGPTDKTCQMCSETLEVNTSAALRSSFCYGEDGCICIPGCESRKHFSEKLCLDTMLSSSSDSTSPYRALDGLTWVGFAIPLLSIAVVLVVFVMKRVRRSRSRPTLTDPPTNPDVHQDSVHPSTHANSSNTSTLRGVSLFGWQALRRELIEREQLLLAGVDDFSNVRTDYIELLDTHPSAPEVEEEEICSAPIALHPMVGASAPPPSSIAFSPVHSVHLRAPTAPDPEDLI